MTQPILEARSLVKKYGALVAVNDVSFAVEEGEIFGLVGPGGAGKSSLINLFTGLALPDSGSMSILGCDVVADLEQVKPLIGTVPQDLALYPTLSGQDNLRFFGEMYGLGGKRLNERVSSALTYAGIAEWAREAVRTYPVSIQRRLNLAVGMLNNPRVLFLDEPTQDADPQSRAQILESIERLNREHGMTILFASRDFESAERLCSRIALLDQGVFLALDTPRGLASLLGGGLILIEVSRADEELLAQISQLSQVRAASLLPAPTPVDSPTGTRRTLKIEAHQASEALMQILTLCQQQGVQVQAVETLEPNLKNAFLHLTGKVPQP